METKVQENKVRQMEFPFRKAPLPAFHDSCTPWFLWLQGAFGSVERLEAGLKRCWVLLSWPHLDSRTGVLCVLGHILLPC